MKKDKYPIIDNIQVMQNTKLGFFVTMMGVKNGAIKKARDKFIYFKHSQN